MKHCILQDSSFLVATMDPFDVFHKDAVYIFQKILENRRNVKVIIPSLVFYETIVTLIKKGNVSKDEIEKKLWRFLYHDMVLNVSLIETNAFKVCKRLEDQDISQLKTQDFIIASIGLEYEAQILTFDMQMRKKVRLIYPSIYYCSNIDLPRDLTDETGDFLKDLYKSLGKPVSSDEDIPF